MEEKNSVVEMALLEFMKTARTMQRQLKIMKPMLNHRETAVVCETIDKLEKEFQVYKL